MASAVAMRWGHGVGLADVLLAVTLYMVTGLVSRPVSTALSRSFTVSSSLNFVNDLEPGFYSHLKQAAPSFMSPSKKPVTSRSLAWLRCFA